MTSGACASTWISYAIVAGRDDEIRGGAQARLDCRLSELVCFGLAVSGLVSLTSSIHGSGNAGGLIGDQILSALHEFFPLSSSAIDVLANLLLAAINKSVHLLLAPIDDGAYVLRSFARTRTQIFSALTCSRGDVIAGFLAALWRIKDTNQSADA